MPPCSVRVNFCLTAYEALLCTVPVSHTWLFFLYIIDGSESIRYCDSSKSRHAAQTAARLRQNVSNMPSGVQLAVAESMPPSGSRPPGLRPPGRDSSDDEYYRIRRSRRIRVTSLGRSESTRATSGEPLLRRIVKWVIKVRATTSLIGWLAVNVFGAIGIQLNQIRSMRRCGQEPKSDNKD